MKRKLLVLALGLGFLLVSTLIVTLLPDSLPRRPTAQVQSAESASYRVTLEVAPNPPPVAQATTLTLRIERRDNGQGVQNAQVMLATNMTSMDMGTTSDQAHVQPDAASYQSSLRFSMSGLWQLRVRIGIPGQPEETVVFEITVQ
jgi:hypothetical protein